MYFVTFSDPPTWKPRRVVRGKVSFGVVYVKVDSDLKVLRVPPSAKTATLPIRLSPFNKSDHSTEWRGTSFGGVDNVMYL